VRAHGTRARYVFGPEGGDWRNGCRCFECSQAAVLYEKRRQRARLRGEPAFVDCAEARAHLEFLRANGVGRRTVARRTGLAASTVSKIVNGRITKARQGTVDKILAVHLGKAADGACVDATRTLQQVDDLVAVCGMKKVEIGRIVHANPDAKALQLGRAGRVTKAHADLIDALWRERMAPVIARREWQASERAKYRARAKEQAS
jgi:transcriptional regulator with XRE-family HTH domain